MSPEQYDYARRHAYGALLIVLGVWEAAAFQGFAPTITSTVRTRPWLRPVWLGLMIGGAAHLWREPRG